VSIIIAETPDGARETDMVDLGDAALSGFVRMGNADAIREFWRRKLAPRRRASRRIFDTSRDKR
jgi:hypothetical protein